MSNFDLILIILALIFTCGGVLIIIPLALILGYITKKTGARTKELLYILSIIFNFIYVLIVTSSSSRNPSNIGAATIAAFVCYITLVLVDGPTW